MQRGRKRKYSKSGLERAVSQYFDTITRERTVTERYDTGEKDEYGHKVFAERPILNRLGQELTVTEYLVPPSVYDLCEFLEISDSTWENYCDPEKHPEFLGTTTRARARMRAWNEKELLTREGKDLKGIIFNLENNYGYRERKDVQVTGGIEDYLKRLEQEGKQGREF